MRTALCFSLALAALAPVPALAQIPGTTNSDPLGLASPGGIRPGGPERKAPAAPPSAVPGAKARPDSVTPLKGGTNDLPPTEALFDAINRGDIVTARDAINRGADLDSTNLLGLTPIELSVDLGRNDISFLLLSLRGAPGSIQANKQPFGAPLLDTPGSADRHGKRATAVVKAPATRPVREAAPSTLHAPALFAGNGGAPIPTAGFLGFDPHR